MKEKIDIESIGMSPHNFLFQLLIALSNHIRWIIPSLALLLKDYKELQN